VIEEQFHLPATPVDLGDGKCGKGEVIGEELESLPGFHVEITHPPQRVRIRFRRVDGGENDGVIGTYAGGLIYRMRVAALQQHVRLGTNNEERRTEREDVQTLEIHVAAVHDVERPGLRQNLVEDIDVMHLAVGDADKCGDVAVQVQQRVHLDGGFVLAESRPGEQRKAEVDGSRVQSVQTLIEIYADRVGGMQWTRNANQHLGEVGVNAPVMRVVGVGQGGPRHATAEAHMVQLAAHRPQARLDIAKTLAVSQLSEGHCQILVATREASVVRITPVAGDTLLKLVGRQMLHELGENSLAKIHLSLSAIANRHAWGHFSHRLRWKKFKSKKPKLSLAR